MGPMAIIKTVTGVMILFAQTNVSRPHPDDLGDTPDAHAPPSCMHAVELCKECGGAAEDGCECGGGVWIRCYFCGEDWRHCECEECAQRAAAQGF